MDAPRQPTGFQRANTTSATAISPCPDDRLSFQLPGYTRLRNAPPTPASALPAMVASSRVRLMSRPSALAASALSPTMRSRSPSRVARNIQAMAKATATPTRNSGLMVNALRTCGTADQPPNGMPGRPGALGCTNGLPKKNAIPLPASRMAMPIATSFTRVSAHSSPCRPPSAAPATAAASTPSHGLPVRYDVA